MQTRHLRGWLLPTIAAALLATAGAGATTAAVDRGEGRIAGRVGEFPRMQGLTPIRVQSVELITGGSPRPTAVATPNDAGEFAFEAVPAGRILLHPVLEDSEGRYASNPSALRAPAIVRAGETLRVILFGKGRPVTGKITLPEYIRPETCRVSLSYLAPPFRVTRGDVGEANHGSPWSAYTKLSQKKLESEVSADGRFRIEGVNAGNYRFSVSGGVGGKPARILPDRRGLEPDRLPERVTIWLMSEEESEKPQDLGITAWIDR